MEKQTSALPHHLAFIPDGNRRYARAHGMSVPEGYLLGLDRVVETVRWLLEQGVSHVSAYAASSENVKERPKIEMIAVFTALGRFFTSLEKVPGVGLHVFGKVNELPDWTPNRQRFIALQNPNPDNKMTVHFALNYSAQDEASYLIEQVERYGAETVRARPQDFALAAGVPPIDLLIRSGGQHRLSGFLPFQTAYSELWFIDKYWPEVSITDLQEAFDWYASQSRNFGK